MNKVRGFRLWLASILEGTGSLQIEKRPGVPPANNKVKVKLLLCLIVFSVAIGTRLLHWDDSRLVLAGFYDEAPFQGLTKRYRSEASSIQKGEGILFPNSSVDIGDARTIIHPPGYPIFIAAVSRIFGQSDTNLRFVQVVIDALCAVVIYFIATELFPLGIALIAGLLAGLSPHHSYYSLLLLPDSISILPILVSILMVAKYLRNGGIIKWIAAGALLGLSCWFRSNSILLAPFIMAFLPIFFDWKKALKMSIVFLFTTAFVISPITLRNYILYHRFIPISIQSGLNLIEGIADYDREGRFGLPRTDIEAAAKDAEWYGRPEYAANLWSPDGIDRDSARFRRGLSVARQNPSWFLCVMARRAAFMLRYNDSYNHEWPFNTALVPVVQNQPGFGHISLMNYEGRVQPEWELNPKGIQESWNLNSDLTSTELDSLGFLRIKAKYTGFDDLLISQPIRVEMHNDYLIKVDMGTENGRGAFKILTEDMRLALASRAVFKTTRNDKSDENNQMAGSVARDIVMRTVRLPFSSGNNKSILLTFSNDGGNGTEIVAGKISFYNYGSTPGLWTRAPRILIKFLQKNLFITNRMIPLILAGIFILVFAARPRTLWLVLLVPLYFLILHAPLHTEYRYILTIHYFLFIFGAVAIYVLAGIILKGFNKLISKHGSVKGEAKSHQASAQ